MSRKSQKKLQLLEQKREFSKCKYSSMYKPSRIYALPPQENFFKKALWPKIIDIYIFVHHVSLTDHLSIYIYIYIYRPVGRGGCAGCTCTCTKSQKGPPDGIVKDSKWYKNNVMMVGLTISMHFQQFEYFKNQEPLQNVQSSQIRRD